MPRLLLVDDNPSIHRIAESLLAHTDVVLVCVSSAPEALDLLGQGERFDAALVDTSMPGMDGWSLLERLRALPETARMPIALMAGVLDSIDPNRLARAPIQGFLKKPIELRELAERVLALAATPVAEPPPPSEAPATPAAGVVEPLTEVLPSAEDDVLVLAEEDLWPEETAAVPEAAPEVVLDLEELDLEILEGDLAEPALVAMATGPEFPSDALVGELEDLDLEVLEGDLAEPAPVALEAESDERFGGWEHPVALAGDPMEPTPVPPEPAVLEALEPEPAALEALEPEPVVLETAEPEPDAVLGQAPAPQGQPAAADAAARALVQAVLADPELLEALARAVVARLGDEALREIAWELMPDLAGRLQK